MSFIELKPEHRVNISQWAEVFINPKGVSVVLTNGKIVEYELKREEVKALFKTMDKLDPTKNMKPKKSDPNAPSKTLTISPHTVMLPDIAGFNVDRDKMTISIVYQKLAKYEQMECRGKYIVEIPFTSQDLFIAALSSLNRAIREYNDYYD